MAWITKRGQVFHLGFRYSGEVFRNSLKTTDEREANAAATRVEETIRLVERGRLSLPDDTHDIATFLLSDGTLSEKPTLPRMTSLRELFPAYADAMTNGSMELNSLDTINIHMRHLRKVLGDDLTA